MKKGLIKLGSMTLGAGVTVSAILIYTIISEEKLQRQRDNFPHGNVMSNHSLQHVFGAHLDRTSIYMIIILLLALSLLTVLFSILLIVGIVKKRPSYLLSYFGFAVFLSLVLMVSVVLQLLANWWYAAVVTVFVAIILLMSLSYVYAAYEEIRTKQPELLIENSEVIDTISNIDFETDIVGIEIEI